MYGYAYGPNLEGGSGGTDIFRVNLNDPDPGIELMQAPINSSLEDIEPVIAPDGSYLVFASNRPAEGIRRIGLFVSFRLDDGRWSEAIALDPSINAQGGAWRAFLTQDGKYLFFQRAWNEYYWVSTEAIAALRPE